VDKVRDIRAQSCWCQRAAAGVADGYEGHGERAEKQRKTDRTELGERLEVQAVRVAHREGRAPVRKPEALVASRTSAEPRVVLVLAPRHSPVLRTAVAGKAEEPPARVCLDERRGSVEGVVGAARGRLTDLALELTERRVAVLCAERDHERCHRQGIIEELLALRPGLALTVLG